VKADITRSTYNKNKKYIKVNAQQGRVQVDADWNEQLDIQAHFDKTMLCDVVGKTGTPLESPGFEIVPDGATGFTIGRGRYYVDGMICENNLDNLNARKQEDLPFSKLFKENSIFPKDEGYYAVYLDVWPRHITFLEDPDLLEVALGRTDTTTRTKNIWQVKTLKIDVTDTQKALANFESKILRSTGKLRARVKPKPLQGGCEPIISTGYSGDENRLYRVEIHSSGTLSGSKESPLAPVFKWSRENAFVAAKILGVTCDPDNENKMSIVIENRRNDDLYTFREDQWVEVTDDYSELWNIPSQILKINEVEDNLQESQSILKVTVSNRCGTQLLDYILDKGNYVSKNPKVRRWNTPDDKWSMLGYTNTLSNAQPDNVIKYAANTDGYIDLEDGIQLKFEAGDYVAGDYWLIPARTITKNIEWPTVTSSSNIVEPEALPSMMEHHYCPLALLKCSKVNDKLQLQVVCDYRNFFSASTSLNFYYVSGDGQKITPNNVFLDNTSPGTPLLLCVGANVGNASIGDTLRDRFVVRFEIVDTDGVGGLTRVGSVGSMPEPFVDVPLVDGAASCGWVFLPSSGWDKGALGKITPGKQQVSATLCRVGPKEVDVKPCSCAPVFFYATFSPPELRCVSGNGQIVSVDGTGNVAPFDLKACLDVAGVPLTSRFLSLWKVKVRFTKTVGGGVLNQSGSVLFSPDSKEGLVSCSWKLDASTLYQQVKVELVDSATNGTAFVGLSSFFNAALSQLPVAVQQAATVATVATSGVIKLDFSRALKSTDPMISKLKSTDPMISNDIIHSIKGDVPPAIILSFLSSGTLTEKGLDSVPVESFEDFGLYNWANAPIGDKYVLFPHFKVVDVNQKSFRVLVEPPYPQSNQVWYLRWWAIPAMSKSIQTATFEPVPSKTNKSIQT
jgi:hypothetical protein